MLALLEFYQLKQPVTATQTIDRACALAIMEGVLKSARPRMSEAQALQTYRRLLAKEAE